jgi:hypothetical protein
MRHFCNMMQSHYCETKAGFPEHQLDATATKRDTSGASCLAVPADRSRERERGVFLKGGA